MTDRFAEVRTARGSKGLVRAGDEGCWADEISREGKRKGREGKGEHVRKGRAGSKGTHQVENMMKGEDDEKEEINQRGDDECRETKFERDLRRLEEQRRAQEEHEQRHEEDEKCENEEENERVRVAPNMGAGGSHFQAMSDSE